MENRRCGVVGGPAFSGTRYCTRSVHVGVGGAHNYCCCCYTCYTSYKRSRGSAMENKRRFYIEKNPISTYPTQRPLDPPLPSLIQNIFGISQLHCSVDRLISVRCGSTLGRVVRCQGAATCSWDLAPAAGVRQVLGGEHCRRLRGKGGGEAGDKLSSFGSHPTPCGLNPRQQANAVTFHYRNRDPARGENGLHTYVHS